MAKQPIPRSLGVAGLSLLITLSGGLVVLLAEIGSWPVAVLLIGLAAVLAGGVPGLQLRSLHTGVQQVAAP